MKKNTIDKIEDVLWSVTDKCNLKCIYCSVSDNSRYIPVKELTKEQIDRITMQLGKLKNLKSLILSGGEALQSDMLYYILEKSSGLCHDIYIITNGTNLTEKARIPIKKYKPNVMVTIDCTWEEVNSITRGKKSLEKSLNTLSVLSEMGIDIIIISVITCHNIRHVISDLKYLYNKGYRSFLLQQLHCEGRANISLYLSLSPQKSEIDKLYNDLIEFESKYPDVNLDYNEICFFPMRKVECEKKCKPLNKYLPQKIFMCGAGFNFFALKTNGDIIPCNAMRNYVLGNIIEDDIDDVFSSRKELIELQKLRNTRVNSIESCENCIYSPICDGGCRADVLNLSGNVLEKHPYCNVANIYP